MKKLQRKRRASRTKRKFRRYLKSHTIEEMLDRLANAGITLTIRELAGDTIVLEAWSIDEETTT